jgi:hypothetical protein
MARKVMYLWMFSQTGPSAGSRLAVYLQAESLPAL